jgi:hypothetical protein
MATTTDIIAVRPFRAALGEGFLHGITALGEILPAFRPESGVYAAGAAFSSVTIFIPLLTSAGALCGKKGPKSAKILLHL